jgi:hypothetical protein
LIDGNVSWVHAGMLFVIEFGGTDTFAKTQLLMDFAISFKPPPSFPLSFISTCELRNFEGFLFVRWRQPGVAIHRQDNIFRWMESPGS